MPLQSQISVFFPVELTTQKDNKTKTNMYESGNMNQITTLAEIGCKLVIFTFDSVLKKLTEKTCDHSS